jgi:ABC-2 type transport system permease protein
MGQVFVLTVRQLISRWRMSILAILAGLPVLSAVIMVQSTSASFVGEFETIVLSALLAGSIVPLIVVSTASVAFSNEVEDQTLANLTLTPLPRWQIVLPKIFGSILVAGPFILCGAFFTGFIAFNRDLLATLAVTVATLAGLLMYASFFTWLGLATRQAIGAGLLYIVLWEGFFSGYVSGIRFLSIRHYSVALMHGLDPRRFADSPHVGMAAAVGMTLAVCALFGWLSTRRLRTMDVP